jgi:hypothetical protein
MLTRFLVKGNQIKKVMTIFQNHKQVINDVNEKLMASLPSLMLDNEIILVSQTYAATIQAILNFGEAELNFRKGERFEMLGLSENVVVYSKEQLTELNTRGIAMLDKAIEAFDEFIESNEFSNEPVPADAFDSEKLKVKEILAQSHLKVSDVVKLDNALSEVIDVIARDGELGVVNFIRAKLVELKNVRLSPSRGTEENIPIWKLIAALILFGIMSWKVLRCILRNRCCRANMTENVIIGILAIAISLC